jgi:hypothetical protein
LFYSLYCPTKEAAGQGDCPVPVPSERQEKAEEY